jgi:hypothetical protein
MLQLGHQIPVRTTNGKKPEHGKPLISSRILRPVTKKRAVIIQGARLLRINEERMTAAVGAVSRLNCS